MNNEQREELIKASIGKVVEDMEYDKEDEYWTMTFTDGLEMSFKFMSDLWEKQS